MISLKVGLIKMTKYPIDEKYYINVGKIMQQKQHLPRPRLKRTILVTGWNEWLQIKTVETGI